MARSEDTSTSPPSMPTPLTASTPTRAAARRGGADDHRAALLAQAVEELDERYALDGVGAVERLVEHEDRGVAHQGGGHPRALAHPLAEATDLAVGHVDEVDGRQGPLGRGAGAHPVEGGGGGAQLAG